VKSGENGNVRGPQDVGVKIQTSKDGSRASDITVAFMDCGLGIRRRFLLRRVAVALFVNGRILVIREDGVLTTILEKRKGTLDLYVASFVMLAI